MFLKTLDIFGFKSFADRTHIEFDDSGITSLLGPNGSGKSNIVDAIKWVLGEQSVKSVRAGKREDVIFNGTDKRKPSQMCEVALLIDNSERIVNIDFSEIEIKRRLFRNGDSEYYLNGEQVHLKTIKELFMDTGVGKTAYSILEQGKIDQILSNKPEERRYVFEEAAGISRFKIQAQEAQRKLEKTDENIEQVNNILVEVKRTYDSRKSQLVKFNTYKEIRKQKESVDIESQLSQLQSYRKLRAFQEDNYKKLGTEVSELEAKLESLKENSRQQSEDLAGLRLRKEGLGNDITRLAGEIRAKEDAVKIYDGQFWQAKGRLSEAQNKAERYLQSLTNQNSEYRGNEQKIRTVSGEYNSMLSSLENLNNLIIESDTNLRECRDSIRANEDELLSLDERRQQINSEIGQIATRIAEELQSLIDGSGYSIPLRKNSEREMLKKLSEFSSLVSDGETSLLTRYLADPDSYKSKIKELFERLNELSGELKGLFQEYSGSIPTFVDELIKPDGIISEKKRLDSDLLRNAEAVQANSENRETLRENEDYLVTHIDNLREDARQLRDDCSDKKRELEGLEWQQERLAEQLKLRQGDYDEARRSIDAEEGVINDILNKINSAKLEIGSLSEQKDAVKTELSDVSAALEDAESASTQAASDISQMYADLSDMKSSHAALEQKISGLNELVDKIYSDFFDMYGKSLKEFDDHEVTADTDELKNLQAELSKKLQNIGYVNQMADEEFKDAEERYNFFNSQLADMQKAKSDLLEVAERIKKQSEELFMASFTQISQKFSELFKRIFAGGKAELSLSDPDNPLSSGIDILAQPPGKKLTYLPLLSGGERSMTAVALLFATYAVKPSPFCILDEIDAALDARNIGYFLSVLEDFSEKSQFIIITHNKNTVMGSRTLLGVMQQEQGVSSMISYRIDSQKDAGDLNLK